MGLNTENEKRVNPCYRVTIGPKIFEKLPKNHRHTTQLKFPMYFPSLMM